MAISIKHKFTNAKPDGPDPTVVRPSNWNDEHALQMATAKLLGRLTGGDGDVEELSAAQVLSFLGGVPAGGSSFYFAEDYGAVGDGTTLDQDPIQDAIDAAYAAGGGIVLLRNVTYAIGVTSDPYDAITTATGATAHLGLVLKSGVSLVGQGRVTTLKRMVSDPLVMVDLPNCDGAQVRNLRVNGNMTNFPISGATFGSGAGLFVESAETSPSTQEDRENIIDTVWIEDTGGYGIGVEWGHHRGLTLRNIFIDGTWSDGIDIKAFNSFTFDAYGIVLDNIHVQNFGQGATDDQQTGIDIRGRCTVSNIYVRKFGAKASEGIRIRGGLTGDNSFGGQKSSVTNFIVEYDGTGGTTIVNGISLEPGDCQASNGSVSGCQRNINFVLAGVATAAARMSLSNIKSIGATVAGFYVDPRISDVDFFGCMDTGSPIGFSIEGDRCRLFGPVFDNTTGTGISITSNADGTQIYGPSFTGTPSATISDSGTNTLILGHPDNTSDKLPGRLRAGGRVSRDANFYLDLSSGNPIILFNTSDYILFDRTNSVWNFTIGGTSKAWLASSGWQPAANDGLSLGNASRAWSDLCLAAGGLLNWANGDAVITHSTGVLNVTTGDLRVTTPGTNASSVVTLSGAQTLTNKSLTAPKITGAAVIGSTTAFSGGAGTPAVAVSGLVGTVNGYFANDGNPVIIESIKSRNATVGAHTVVQSGDSIAEWRVEGSDGTNFVRLGQMRWSVDNTPGTNDMPGRMGIFTTPDGSATPLERFRVDSAGNVLNNPSGTALATTATAGFPYIPTCAGAPTGVPTSYTGAVPMVYDSTNNNFYIYNGAWKKVLLS